MHRLILATIYFVSTLIFLLVIFSTVHAETYVDQYDLTGTTNWNIQGSPYILEHDINIPLGSTLVVDPGVKITSDPSSVNGYSIFAYGTLFLNGFKDEPIIVDNLRRIEIHFGQASIVYSDINVSEGTYFIKANSYIASSTFSGAFNGISAQASHVYIQSTRINNNYYGLNVSPELPRLVHQNIEDGTGGIGNALADNLNIIPIIGGNDYLVTIVDSNIIDNSEAAIINSDSGVVMAENNWWGNVRGPSRTGSNKIVGQIIYEPWLKNDPALKVKCCSNVLFIPGIEASRLYNIRNVGLGLVNVNHRLWEPVSNNDVEDLLLDQSGLSTNSSIYSGKPIDKAFGLVDVYGQFFNFLDDLVKQKAINQWKSFGYDWRKSVDDIVAGPERKATTTDSLVAEVLDLAATSNTGKVTIIAHSNGGLITKYLVKILSDLGYSELVDKVISVAVPYLGTPEAILGLLHGADQSIANGLLIKEDEIRKLGQNMTSAYSLLPSRKYFSLNRGPIISFNYNGSGFANHGSYPEIISSFDDMFDYIGDTSNDRSPPADSDTNMPIRGNQLLLGKADGFHQILDNFHWPESIQTWAISGWNKSTARGISYYESKRCDLLIPIVCPRFKALTTKNGDGTVVFQSASYDSGNNLALDLTKVSAKDKFSVSHMNILEGPTSQALIKKIIEDDLLPDEVLPEGVSGNLPNENIEPVSLVISTHSPVSLDVYDDQGNHTGLVPIPAEMNIEADLYSRYEENIPGSTFRQNENGDLDYDSYIDVPLKSFGSYSIVVKGLANGTFDLDIDKVQGDTVLDEVKYKDIPVTPFTVASTTVEMTPTLIGPNPCFKINTSLASSTTPLNLGQSDST